MPQLESTSTGAELARGGLLGRGEVGVGRGRLVVGTGTGFAAGFVSAAFVSARMRG